MELITQNKSISSSVRIHRSTARLNCFWNLYYW